MSYYDDEPRSSFGLQVSLAVIVLCLIGYWAFSSLLKKDTDESAEKPLKKTTPESQMIQTVELPEIDELPVTTPEQALLDSGTVAEELDPQRLLQQIAASLNEGNLEATLSLIGRDKISEEQLSRLKALHASQGLKLDQQQPIVEIGELDRNRRLRYALKLENEESRIYFDLKRQAGNGKWAVEKLTLSGKKIIPEESDSLTIAHQFLTATISQKFERAKSFVDSTLVSDAKIAGLCIIFEEGAYRLPQKKPLRAMFNRDLTAAFKARVETANGERVAEFGLNVQRESTKDLWKVTEINLQSLLADYATRFAGGDVHYTPLVKNPSGGDTLILYFGFDEETLTARTTRQLDIVASLLKTDPEKNLTLSGHTDALGSDQYNDQLSARRALAVEKYLLSVGVPPAQIKKIAEGERNPRLPNTDSLGQDQPKNRRANRRAEIYLDF